MTEVEDKKYKKLFNKYQIVKSKSVFEEDKNEINAYYVKKNERFIFKYGEFFGIFFQIWIMVSMMIAVVSFSSFFFTSITYMSVFITLQVIVLGLIIFASAYDDVFKVRFKRQCEAENYISEKIKKKNHVDSKASEGVIIKEFLIAKN